MSVTITPSNVEIGNIAAGVARSVIVNLKNEDKRAKTLRIRPPKSKYFSIRGWQPQSLAPGLTTSFEVVFEASSLDSIKEFTQDKIVVQSEAGEIEVPLKALLPRPNVTVTGDLNFGLLPLESKATRKFRLHNQGKSPVSFKLDYDKSQGLLLDPPEGEIPPASGAAGSGSLEIVAALTADSTGALGGDILVVVDGLPEDPKKIAFSATGVKHVFDLADSSGVLVSEVDFGEHYFGEEIVRTVQLFNNGPIEGNFMISYGTPSEIRAKVEDADGSAGADDPYSGFIMNARQKSRARISKDNPFSISPSNGVLAPYSRTSVIIRYKPEDVSKPAGFTTTAKLDGPTKAYDFVALVELLGHSNKLKIPIRAKAIAPGLKLTPPVLDFADVMTNDYADQLILAVNTNASIPVKFKVVKSSPYFDVQPPTGLILGGNDLQLLVRYCPKALGKHTGRLPVQVYSEGGHLIQEVTLHLTGSSLRQGGKAGLVGGTSALPGDFTRPKKFLDGDQMVASIVDAHKKSTKRGMKPWDNPDLSESLANIGATGNEFAYSKEALIAVTKHREKYDAVLGSKRIAKEKAHLTRKINEDDVNLGMNTRSGLPEFEPKLPRSVDPLWTVGQGEAGMPKQQRTILEREVEGIPVHPDRPRSDIERQQCERELTKEQIGKLIVGPKVVDFGTLSVSSSATRSVLFVNPLDTFVHVVFDIQNPPELRKSPNASQVIPPRGRAKFPLVFNALEVRDVLGTIEYSINSNHIMSVGISAEVLPVSLDLSAEDLHFEFSVDNWDSFIDKALILDNPNKFPVEYTIESSGGTFACSPNHGVVKSSSSGEVLVRWTPPLDGSACGTRLTGSLTLTLVGGYAPRTIHLQGQLPEGKLRFKDKEFDAGMVSCGVPQTVIVQLKNDGTCESSFKVQGHPTLQISPEKGKLAADDTIDLEVTFNCLVSGAFSTTIEVEVQGNKPLKLPFMAEGVIPAITISEDEFDFGATFIGNRSKLPFTLVNLKTVPAMATVDLRQYPELQLLLSKEAWSQTEYEACPLQRLGRNGEFISTRSSAASSMGGSRLASRPVSANGRQGNTANEGAMYHITLNPSAKLDMHLVYRPSTLSKQDIELQLQTLGNGIGTIEPIRKVVSLEGTQPQLIISKTVLDFSSQIIIRSNQTKPPYSNNIFLQNTSLDGLPLSVTFGKALSTKGAEDNISGVFAVKPDTLVIDSGDSANIAVQFTPRDARPYEATIPVYLGDDFTSAYLTLEVSGTGQFPRLSFDVRECVMPPVPLGITSKATFTIINNGYDNLELRYRLPADESHIPMKIEFPQGNLIGIAKQDLPVTVMFNSAKPLSFTASIDFMDQEGKRFSIPVTATTDNCLLTHQAFIKTNAGALNIQRSNLQSPVMLDPPFGSGEYHLPSAATALGPVASSTNLCRFIAATSSRGGLEGAGGLAAQLASTRGKLAIELIELLAGKPVPGKISKLSSNRTEAAEQLLGLFDSLLVFLKSHGALLNAVKPEMLLDLEDFGRILTARDNKAISEQEKEAIALWGEVELNFATISAQAWNMLIFQAFKVFVLGRVTLKAFKLLPGNDRVASTLPPDSTITGSNLYSVPESVLLSWMTAHFLREFGAKGQRVTNFDEDLRNGLVWFSLLSGYWPSLSAKRSLLNANASATHQDMLKNNEVIVKLLADLGLPFDVKAEELTDPDPKESLVFALYLFQTLPQFVPKTKIEFACKLGESVTKDLELSNPSKKSISYSVRLEGHKDFTTQASVVHIDAKGSIRVPLRCMPTTTMPVSSRLVLMSRRDGGAHAATLVFLLESKVDTRSPLKRIRAEGPLYEMQQFEINVANPFQSEGDFAISLLHEPAEPPIKEPDDKKGKKGGRGKGQDPGIERPKVQIHPNALGVDRTRIRLKQGGADKLRGFFLPFTMGTHHCTIVFKDQALGQFVYEIVADASLPSPQLEAKGVVPLEGPHTYNLSVPWVNANLEAAKKMFAERHPLAKDKVQSAYLKSTPATSIEYTLTQTNTLIACPRTLTLNASGAADETSRKLANGTSAKAASAAAAVAAGENSVALTLKPLGPGVYPSRLLLTSPTDVRIIDLELTSQTLKQQFQLDFSCPVRHSITQEVPLVNTSDQAMTVQAVLDGGKSWTGGKDISVPAGGTVNYVITFKPLSSGGHKGQLELLIPSTGERNVYALSGKGTEPLAEGHIILETQARKPVFKSISVPNIVGAPVEYQVLTDLPMVSGPATLKSSANSATSYKITSIPLRAHMPAPHSAPPPQITSIPLKAGTFMGSITFRTPDGQMVWYAVEVRASEAGFVDTVQINAQVGSAVAIKVPMKNPLEEPVTMNILYSQPVELLGPTSLLMPVSTQQPTLLEFYFAPLRPGRSSAILTIENEELGEFKYQLELFAEPAEAIVLPELSAELGGRPRVATIRVDNPFNDRSAAFTVTTISGDGRCFQASPSTMTLPPLGHREVSVQYTPSSLSTLDEAVVRIDGGADAGVLDYRLSGRGVPPAPAERTSLFAVLGGEPGQCAVQWRNPFPDPVEAEFEFAVTSGPPGDLKALLEPSQRRQTVPPGEEVHVSISFHPSSLQTVDGEVTVSVPTPPGEVSGTAAGPLCWRLPVRGIAEAAGDEGISGPAFRFQCEARSRVEQNIEIVLNGLATVSPEDEFSHEVVIAPGGSGANVDHGVLQVVPVSTSLSRPDQPLVYRVLFAPKTSFASAEAELVVHKASGGRWRFDLHLQASEPNCDGTITIEAGMDQTSYVPLMLHSSSGSPEAFSAAFSSDTPLLFDVTVDKGLLMPRRDDGGSGLMFGGASLPAPDAAVGAPLWVSYTCRDFGKVLKGRLVISTEAAQYTFDLKGKVKAYVAPKAADMTTTVDHKLAKELEERLSLTRAAAGTLEHPNYVAKNAKRNLGNWTGRKGQ